MRCPTLSELPPPPPGKTGWPWTEQTETLPEKMPNGSDWPRISIVTPSYNQGMFIEKTIRSVLLQGYPNLEYIIIDGASTDISVEIIKKYEPWLSYWISEPDNGQSEAINKGFAKTNGEILAWLNSDDYYLPNAFMISGAFPWKYGIGAIVGIGHTVDIHDRILCTLKPKETNFQAFLDWMSYSNFLQPSCFINRKAWLDCGPLDTSLDYCMDLKLWLEISQRYSLESVNYVLSCALAHDASKTVGQGVYSRAETILLISKYGAEDIAKRELYSLVDSVKKYDLLRNRLEKLPFFKSFVSPLYRKLLQR
ncbi:glycosyltransferase [Richelia sinica FACHB-800]|nr:glycosyltransferase [Richelia sinica FACHB-800]